jgi:hypothetical protein
LRTCQITLYGTDPVCRSTSPSWHVL